ncbi:MAG TPA: hypothetical protein VJJ02_00195 [Candidatus Paceibacterota bacterium]
MSEQHLLSTDMLFTRYAKRVLLKLDQAAELPPLSLKMPHVPKRGDRLYLMFVGDMLSKRPSGWYEVIESVEDVSLVKNIMQSATIRLGRFPDEIRPPFQDKEECYVVPI